MSVLYLFINHCLVRQHERSQLNRLKRDLLRIYSEETVSLIIASLSAEGNTKIIAFDGAGGEYTGNNHYFRDLARRYGAILFDENSFSFHRNGKAALLIAEEFFKANPKGKLYLMGYSAGGDEAIWVANRIARAGYSVTGLVTFDPHQDSFVGIKNYEVPSGTKALNFFQQNKFKLGTNTFHGGIAAGAGNALIDSIHNDIVSDSYRSYYSDIDSIMGFEK